MEWLSSYVLYILLAVSVAVTFLWLYYNREKLNAKWYALLIMSVMSIFCGLTTVKFFAFLESLVTGKATNMSIFGAVFFMPIALFIGALVFRRKVSLVFDIFTVPLLFTLLCSRINCLNSGCCKGKPIPFYYAVLVSIIFSARTASFITLLGNTVRDNRNSFSHYS